MLLTYINSVIENIRKWCLEAPNMAKMTGSLAFCAPGFIITSKLRCIIAIMISVFDIKIMQQPIRNGDLLPGAGLGCMSRWHAWPWHSSQPT